MDFSKKIVQEGLTFDDVLLIPAKSEVLPADISLKTRLTNRITLNIPLMSSAMDTVTEAEMAIAMAREGGVGTIHKNMSIERQAEMVDRVKRSENGVITNPIFLHPDNYVYEAENLMHKFRISGVPICDENKKLVGIITNRDMRFMVDFNVKISEVMTKENLVTAQKGISLPDATDILRQYKIEKLPVVDADGKLVGLITYKDLMKIKDNPIASKDSKGRLLVAAAVGVNSETVERIEMLVSAGADAVVVDTAHGHSQGVLNVIKNACQALPDVQIVAGNVATAEGAKALADAGVSAVKVGIGPGSICTTRVIAGVGMPQLSAVMMASEALKGTGVPVIADGGIRYSGDVVKALAAGASTIMAGSLFAGVEESPGETIILNGRKYKSYRGMGSLEAMQQGSKDRYFQDMEADIKKLVPEGIVAQVPYKGTLNEVVYQLVGGLRAGMGYCGAGNIEKLREARFVRITNAGYLEGHPHDVTITREAPNYSR